MIFVSVFNGILLIRIVLKLICSEKFIYFGIIEVYLFFFCKYS